MLVVLGDILDIKPSHLVICGDLEHHYSIKNKKKGKNSIIEIPTEMSNSILQHIKSDILTIDGLEIIIISGENDISFHQELKGECKIFPSSGGGLFSNQLGVFHGDNFPYKEIVFSSDIVLGHVHPVIEIRDELQVKHQLPVFVKLELLREDIFSLLLLWLNPGAFSQFFYLLLTSEKPAFCPP